MLSLIPNSRSSIVGGWCSRLGFTIALCTVAAPVCAQATANPQSTAKDEKKERTGTSHTSAKRLKSAVVTKRGVQGRLQPFYDVSFHSVTDPLSVNLSDYLVDEKFWGRRPTLVIVTPVSPNVLQPDEGYAEATTEALLRQLGADLGVKDTTEQVSKTIDFLRRLRDRAKRSSDSQPDQGKREPDSPPKDEKPADPPSSEAAQAEARGLQTVQLILLQDTRPIWNGISVYDRAAVADRSLSKYLEKLPAKQARLLDDVEQDQFRFSAFLGKDAVNQMLDSLGVRRSEFHVLVCNRDGEVVQMWNKYNLDPKQVSAAYRRLDNDADQNGE